MSSPRLRSTPSLSTSHRRLQEKLEQMGASLDALPATALGAVRTAITTADGDPDKGRKGMSADQVLRAMVIQRMTGWSCDELTFRLQDSSTLRGFCRIGPGDSFSESMLEKNLQRITPQTWECVRHHLVADGPEQWTELEKQFRRTWK